MIPSTTAKRVTAGSPAPKRPREQRRIIPGKAKVTRGPPAVTSAIGLRLLSYAQLKLRGIPYSRSHLRRLEALRQFPCHVTLGEGLGALIAWPEHEVDGWIAERMARRAPTTEVEAG